MTDPKPDSAAETEQLSYETAREELVETVRRLESRRHHPGGVAGPLGAR